MTDSIAPTKENLDSRAAEAYEALAKALSLRSTPHDTELLLAQEQYTSASYLTPTILRELTDKYGGLPIQGDARVPAILEIQFGVQVISGLRWFGAPLGSLDEATSNQAFVPIDGKESGIQIYDMGKIAEVAHVLGANKEYPCIAEVFEKQFNRARVMAEAQRA